MLRLENLAKLYGLKVVFKGVSCRFTAGSITLLAGGNGAGKSTTLNILTGYLPPTSGQVLVDGMDVRDIRKDELRRRIGVVMQNGKLFQGDIYSNIVISAPWLSQQDAWEAAELTGIAEDIRRMPMGMNTVISEGSGGISGGQRQRVLLARALISRPEVMLLDEPTSFLDIKGKIELLTILQKLAHEQGLAVIVSLHELDMAQKIADAVVCVFPDHVSGVLTPDAAFAPDNIRSLYALSEAQAALAVKTAQILGCTFAGVDLLFGENGEMTVCEVNSNAHFAGISAATGVNIADKIIEAVAQRI